MKFRRIVVATSAIISSAFVGGIVGQSIATDGSNTTVTQAVPDEVTTVAALSGNAAGCLTISLKVGAGNLNPRATIDGTAPPGTWVATLYGTLYRHTDGKWCYPAPFGTHTVTPFWDAPVTFAGVARSTTTGTTTTSSTTTTTAPPGTSKTRFAKRLGLQQPYPTGKTIYDVLADTPNHHAKLIRGEAHVPVGCAWSYSSLDRLMAAAKAEGVSVLLQTNYTPRDLWEPGWVASWGDTVASWPRSAANQDGWVRCVRQLVAYLAPKWPGTFVAIEASNEPNGWEFGAAQGKYPVNADQYAALLKKLYPAVRTTAPEIIVITGGTAPGSTDGTQVSPNDWHARLKAAGALPGVAFDFPAVHLYDGVNACYSQCIDRIAGYFAGVQVWATEQGAHGDNPAWVGSNIDAWRTKSYAGPWLHFTGFDRNCTAASFDGYGIRRCDGAAKTSFAEFARRAP